MIKKLVDELIKDSVETTMLIKGYEGTDRLRAGLMYEMLMSKKVSGEHMDMGTPSHKSEIMIKEVTKRETRDIDLCNIVYKVEFTAVVIDAE